MTIPAMAPPESPPPPPPPDFTADMVTFAPVATGAMNAAVVLGLTVAVATLTRDEIPRIGGPAGTTPATPTVATAPDFSVVVASAL